MKKSTKTTATDPHPHECLYALDLFAAQRSRLDWRDYGNDPQGRAAFKGEASDIRKALGRYKRARKDLLTVAKGSTDAGGFILEAAPRAFSGRLEWKREGGKRGAWSYTTGQYFPTEYRNAAASVLEEAARLARLRNATVKPLPVVPLLQRTLAAAKADNKEAGNCWFDRSSMRFFGTKFHGPMRAGGLFITSEKGPRDDEPRAFTVRRYDFEGHSVETVGEFMGHKTLEAAREALKGA